MNEDKPNTPDPLSVSNKDLEYNQTSPLGEGRWEKSTVPDLVDNYDLQGPKWCREMHDGASFGGNRPG
ncbi:unnamed protein product [Dicrocoelium dendriticum]|nr:unnamed protein product [Dicrocoelium dendriticum]